MKNGSDYAMADSEAALLDDIGFHCMTDMPA